MPTSPRPDARQVRVVRDLMTTDVVTVDPDASIALAIERLADSHVSGIAVVDLHGRILGVISTTDILAVEAEAGDAEAKASLITTASVRDVMTPRPLAVGPDLEIREAALQMDYGDVHRLFVEDNGQLIGVLSRSDINRAFAAGRLA